MSRPSALRVAESLALLPVRAALGAVFIFAGLVKLEAFGPEPLLDVSEFARTIVKFRMLDPDTNRSVIELAAHAIPWAELIAGACLVVGLATRAAATLIGGMLVLFLVAILAALARSLELECGCFGDINWPCGPRVGLCHVARNAILLGAAALVVWRGGGLFALERAFGMSPRTPAAPTG